MTCCNDCGYIDKHTNTECTKCHSKNIDYATRVIGYLTIVSGWSKERREEHKRRVYSKIECKKEDNKENKEENYDNSKKEKDN